MCGIIGRWSRKPVEQKLFERMRDTLSHRGPDGYGSWFNEKGNLALGHRRLSFLDLSHAGSQPICNEDQSIWITVNGEIYNYIELRDSLREKGHRFASDTDSEVIVHAYEEWGMDMISRLEGMFAFGLWDANKNKLYLGRDRFGIKPLFYYLKDELIFASEIKAIIEDRSIAREIDYSSMSDFFVYRYVPSPKTIFKNIYKLPPAHYLEMHADGTVKTTEYHQFSINEDRPGYKKLIKQISDNLAHSVKIHVRSDVPVGSFLSGGYDSSTLVKYYSEIEQGFNSFSIGFRNWQESEHQYAELVADIYKTNHYSHIVSRGSLDLLDTLMYHYDDPIADISIIPTYEVSRMAAQHNKAVLSGEGADELFAGYTWHRKYLWELSKKELRQAKREKWDLPENHFDVDSYAQAMAMGNFDKKELERLLHPDLHTHIPDDTKWFYRQYYDRSIPTPKRFQYMDIKCFMAELVLQKIDRASMAHSLEVRVPFLNNKLAERMLQLHPKKYFTPNKQKKLLRNILKKDMPKTILQRKKQGFTGPDTYYQDFDFYRNQLAKAQCIKDRLIQKQAVDSYLQNKDHWRLWKILVFEKWYSNWLKD